MFWLVVTVVITLLLFSGKFKNWFKAKTYWQSRGVKVFDPAKVKASRWKVPRHELEFLVYDAIKKEGCGGYTGYMEGSLPVLYVTDPDLIKHIMVKDFDCFVDRRVANLDKTDPLFGLILTHTKGQFWKDLRSTLTPAFSSGKIRRMYSIFTDASEKLTKFIDQEVALGQDPEFHDLMTRYAMDVISSCAFGLETSSFSKEESEFGKYARRFQNQFASFKKQVLFKLRLTFPLIFEILNIPVTDQEAGRFFRQVINKTIEHREKTGQKRDDLLQLLMDARTSTAPPTTGSPPDSDDLSNFEKQQEIKSSHARVQLTEDLVLAQCLLFFFAGVTTVVSQLVMAAQELAFHPEIQQKLYEELKEAEVKGAGKLDYDTVMTLEYLDKVIQETLRKWPNSIILERMTVKPFKVPNSKLTIEKDTLIIVPQYGLQRDERHFSDPDKFDPERFNAENKGKINQYTNIPFGIGPRSCIATRFALAETKAALSNLILKFKLEPSAKTVMPGAGSSGAHFKPLSGLWLSLKRRQ